MVQYRFDVKLGKGVQTRHVFLYARNRCDALNLAERGNPGWSILYVRANC